MSVAEILDRRIGDELEGKSLLLDTFWELVEMEEPLPSGDDEDDEDSVRRSDEIYAWAKAHNVRVRI
jgi:hypothetical protein